MKTRRIFESPGREFVISAKTLGERRGFAAMEEKLARTPAEELQWCGRKKKVRKRMKEVTLFFSSPTVSWYSHFLFGFFSSVPLHSSPLSTLPHHQRHPFSPEASGTPFLFYLLHYAKPIHHSGSQISYHLIVTFFPSRPASS